VIQAVHELDVPPAAIPTQAVKAGGIRLNAEVVDPQQTPYDSPNSTAMGYDQHGAFWMGFEDAAGRPLDPGLEGLVALRKVSRGYGGAVDVRWAITFIFVPVGHLELTKAVV
jgi:hypothetical protein